MSPDRSLRHRHTLAHERAASDRFARERIRGERFGRPPPGRFRLPRAFRASLPRLYLPDNL